MVPSRVTRILPRATTSSTAAAHVLALVHNEYLQQLGATTTVRRMSQEPSKVNSSVSCHTCVYMQSG